MAALLVCQNYSDYYLFGKADLEASLGFSPDSLVSPNLAALNPALFHLHNDNIPHHIKSDTHVLQRSFCWCSV